MPATRCLNLQAQLSSPSLDLSHPSSERGVERTATATKRHRLLCASQASALGGLGATLGVQGVEGEPTLQPEIGGDA